MRMRMERGPEDRMGVVRMRGDQRQGGCESENEQKRFYQGPQNGVQALTTTHGDGHDSSAFRIPRFPPEARHLPRCVDRMKVHWGYARRSEAPRSCFDYSHVLTLIHENIRET